MSIEIDDGGVEISVWNATRNDVVNHYEEDCSCDMGPDEIMDRKRHRQGTSPGKRLEQQFSHWCQRCECAFRRDDASNLQFVCPVCGTSLTEFSWHEITAEIIAEKEDWNRFKEQYINYFEEAVGDGYDPDKYF